MKKLYKNTILQFIFALCVISLAACQEYSIDSQPEGPLKIEIDAMDAYEIFATSPENVSFNISSNTPWTITSDKQWCKVTPSMSSASSLISEIAVAFDSNEDITQPRAVKLTIKAEGITEYKVITVTQFAKADLQVVKYSGEVPGDGAQISFQLQSNKAWRILPSDIFLSDISNVSGGGSSDVETITINIPANPGAKRTGNITVKTDFAESVFSITQEGVFVEMETPGVVDFTAGNEGESQTIKIKSNIDNWDVKVPEDYANWISAKKLSQTELKVTLTKGNPYFIARSGKVMLIGTGDTPVDVTQSGIQYTFAGDPTQNVIGLDGSIKISKQGNHIISKYGLKKGRIIVKFSDIHFTGETSRMYFNNYTGDAGKNDNFNSNITKTAVAPNPLFRAGGTYLGGGGPVNKTFASLNEVNAIRKVEFISEDDPNNLGKLRLRLLIDDVEIGAGIFSNRPVFYEQYGIPVETVKGLVFNAQFLVANAGDYYVIKSIEFESY